MALFQCQCYSDALGVCVSVWVILPQQAQTQIGLRTVERRSEPPVLYLLHGLSDDHSIWLRRTSIERYAEAKGIAVVMPAVNRSFYSDMRHGYKYWTFVSQELPGLMNQFFRISGRRQDTFVAGLSMGGYGAFKLALSFPDRFAAAASLSGALDIAGHLKGRDHDIFPDFMLCFEDPRKLKGTGEDLFTLAKKISRRKGKKPMLYQCCGTEDFLYAENVHFRDHALKLGLDLTYDEGPGTHEWGYWDDRIQAVLDWLPIEKNKEG